MSNKAMDWAFDSGLPPGPRFVLVVLGDHGNDHSGQDWTCFPSVERIISMTGFSRATIERHLAWLWAEGWISRKRRRRQDGRLGIYDYQLHRMAETRAALKAQRASRDQAEDEAEGEPPHVNLQHGPCVISSAAMPQNEGQPCRKLQHQEPPLEPSKEPSEGAREPGGEGFEEVLQLWPLKGRKRTKAPEGRAAWAYACSELDPEQLRQIVVRAASDPDLVGGDYGPPGLHSWLQDERWRAYLPGTAQGACSANGVRVVWPGPAEIRTAVLAAKGEAFAASYLDPAGWNGAAIVARTRTAAGQLRQAAGRVLSGMGVEVLDPS